VAHLIEINTGTPGERRAQDYLARVLPSSWIVTTNIDERHFGTEKTEIDCAILAPIGVFLLDFKNHWGAITPSVNGPWKVRDGTIEEKNPFNQMRRHIFLVTNKLKKRFGDDRVPWIEGLVVFTNETAKLDWEALEAYEPRLRLQAVKLDETESSVRSLASNRPISAEAASTFLNAFDVKVPDDVFREWSTGSSSAASQFNFTQKQEASPVQHNADGESQTQRNWVELNASDWKDWKPPVAETKAPMRTSGLGGKIVVLIVMAAAVFFPIYVINSPKKTASPEVGTQSQSTFPSPSLAPNYPPPNTAPTPQPMITTAGIVQEAGLVGLWAPHCGQPASPANTYMQFATAQNGEATLTILQGATRLAVNVRGAQRVAPDKISMNLQQVFPPGGAYAVFLIGQGTFRPWFQKADNGQTLIENGINLTSQSPMLWRYRCNFAPPPQQSPPQAHFGPIGRPAIIGR
jgi:hypothetical protein